MKAEKTAQVAPNQGGAGNHDGGRDTRGISRIVWLEDGPYIASEPVESTACVIDDKGNVVQRPSCMVSKVERRATADEVAEWRIRP